MGGCHLDASGPLDTLTRLLAWLGYPQVFAFILISNHLFCVRLLLSYSGVPGEQVKYCSAPNYRRTLTVWLRRVLTLYLGFCGLRTLIHKTAWPLSRCVDVMKQALLRDFGAQTRIVSEIRLQTQHVASTGGIV
jgi:hypothetical protein